MRGTWKLPKVSIHVPCYNEPPEMMIDTIRALEKLDYRDFEVLIIDNNTKDDAVWQPVEAYVASLDRPNFKFFHLPKWPGYKAGALNYALTQTDPDAEIVATIDSDYEVRPEWLKDLVPYFADPKVALMQAPQDYRDAHEDLFKRMCFWEYAGFFHLGMKTPRREQRDHPARHHGADPQVGADRGRRLGRMVHHRGCRAWPAPVRGRAIARSIPRRATARA